MIKIKRKRRPKILKDNFPKKTSSLLANPAKKVFDARTKLYKETKDVLMLMTQGHCSFCDGFPIANTGDAIEHFKPASKFPKFAYEWKNLYYICTKCNSSKGDEFDERLLKPDGSEYSFEKYFEFNAREAKIEPTKDDGVSDEDKARAERTIKLYDLNRKANITERRRMIKNFVKGRHERDDFPFRYIIDLELI